MYKTVYFCSTHTTYQARRAPKGNCAKCLKAYKRERKIGAVKDRIAKATSDLSRLMNTDVVVDARYHRPELFCHEGGFKVRVERKANV